MSVIERESDACRPCTRCESPNHSFLECRKDPVEQLGPVLERIALELEIANNIKFASGPHRDSWARAADWSRADASMAKRK